MEPKSLNQSSCWIFLSHASADIEKIRMIRNEFEACGHNPLAFHLKCLNDSTPEGEQELWDLIFREIDTRDWFVFCQSKASLESKNVAKERAHIIDIGKKFVWDIDLSLSDDKIKDRVHKICSQIRIFVSCAHGDMASFGFRFVETLLNADYDVWADFTSITNGSDYSREINKAISVYGATGICLCLITEKYLNSPFCMQELNYILNSGANSIALVFDDVELPPSVRNLRTYRISHLPQEEDALMIKELLDAILQVENKEGPIEFDAHVYDKICEIDERLNYTHRYHSMDPVKFKTLGPLDDYAEIWKFPCCDTFVRTGDRVPSRYRADGCKCDD